MLGREDGEVARILLVEDEVLVRELASEDLGDAGHEVVAAGDGERALEVLEADRRFDLLFTDIRMPGSVDGWELATQARRLIPGLKVIYSSGLSEKSDSVQPGDGILVKPYRPEELSALLDELLPAG